MTKFSGLLEEFAKAQRIKEEIEIRRINKQLERERRPRLGSPEGLMMQELTRGIRAEMAQEIGK